MLECRRLLRLGCLGRVLLGMTLCALASWLSAQKFDNLHPQTWSTEQGLPQDSVHRIYQDHSGFIWVATEAGIARFDGVNFKVFDRASEPAFLSDDTCCITEDLNHDLWVGTADGLLRIHNQSFTRFSERDGLPSSAIRSLVTDSGGSLMVLTAAGLVRWNESRFEVVPQAPPGIEAIERQEDSVWLLSDRGVYRLKGSSVISQTLIPSNVRPKGISITPDGTVWTYTNTEIMSAGTGRVRRWRAGTQLPGKRVQSLYVDRAGAAWVGTDDGVAYIGKGASSPVAVPSLRGNSVLQTMEDREGNYWIGTESSGLHLLRPLTFRTQPGTENRFVTAVVQASTGVTWLGTRHDGLLRFSHGEMDQPVHPESLTSPLILSLAAGPDGSVWAGTPDGLNHIDVRGRVQRWTSANGLPDDYILALASGIDGCVWIGTRRGLAHLCGSRIDVQTRGNGLAGDLIGTLLLVRTGDLWIGTSGGISRRTPDGHIINYGAGRNLAQGIVSAIAEDGGGEIWIASRSSGLSRIKAETLRTVNSGLFSADILGMVADGQGYLWLRRERGMDRVAVADLDACLERGLMCSPHLRHYGIADGLTSEEMTPSGTPGLWMMTDGELWTGTRRGVGVADTGHIPQNPVPPGVAIESFLVDAVALATDSGPVTISYGSQRFTMEYAGLSFVVPSEVRYRFKLEGYDTGWTEAGTRRFATYTNLPPRSFTFRVQAMNNDGVWNREGAAYSFRIVPPFYRRWWFLAMMAFCLGAIAYGIYRLRLRRFQLQFQAVLNERNRMAREIHDTLAQDFVGVTLQLDIIAQMLGMNRLEAAVRQVQQARKLVTEGLAEARQSIWELRANAATDSLPTRLGRVVERYTGEKPVIRTKIGGAFRPLDRRIEAEVLRVAQEALSNVQRHSGAANALLELHYGPATLVLTIEDDGRGFVVEDALRSHERYGLSGLKERASLLGGTLDLASEPGKGTRITLTTEIAGRKDKMP